MNRIRNVSMNDKLAAVRSPIPNQRPENMRAAVLNYTSATPHLWRDSKQLRVAYQILRIGTPHLSGKTIQDPAHSRAMFLLACPSHFLRAGLPSGAIEDKSHGSRFTYFLILLSIFRFVRGPFQNKSVHSILSRCVKGMN